MPPQSLARTTTAHPKTPQRTIIPNSSGTNPLAILAARAPRRTTIHASAKRTSKWAIYAFKARGWRRLGKQRQCPAKMDFNQLTQRGRAPLFIIAGPCVIESLESCLEIGRHVKKVCQGLGLAYIFKASFDKANRSSNASFRGPGLEAGLKILDRVKGELGVPVLTDVHEPHHAEAAGKVVDVLQVPAFLARQTDLLLACGKTGKAINVKKGQFMAPAEMGLAIEKIRSTGNENIMLTERGTFFGYGRLVNDFTGLAVMAKFGRPVVFDVTHSTQMPAGLGNTSGGNPEYSPLLARAAVATGVVEGLFLECHPEPRNAKSDAATMMGLGEVEGVLRDCVAIRKAIKEV